MRKSIPGRLSPPTRPGYEAKTQAIVAKHMTSILFLVQFNNFGWLRASIGCNYTHTVAARSYAILSLNRVLYNLRHSNSCLVM